MNFRRWQTAGMGRKAYPSEVTDDEWAFVAPYLMVMKEEAPQREYPLRDVLNGLRWVIRTGVDTGSL
jgi:transposase